MRISNTSMFRAIFLVGLLTLGLALTWLSELSQPVAAAASAQSLILVTNLSDSGPGSLREAIATANSRPGDDIINATAVRGVINLQSPLPPLSSNIDLRGPGFVGLIVRRGGGGDYRIFEVASGATVSISGLTISDGQVFNYGGGIRNGGNLTVTFCQVSGNTCGLAGGGIYNDSGASLTVRSSIITGNTAAYGGGIGNRSGEVSVSDSIISANRVQGGDNRGGGLYNWQGTMLVERCTIAGNSTTENYVTTSRDGGGIYSHTGTLTVTDSTLENNTSFNKGGGIASVEYNRLTVTGCAFESNTSAWDGGGIFHDNNDLTVSNSRFNRNTAKRFGGGLANAYGAAVVDNCFFTSNTATEGGAIINSYNSSGSLTLTNSTLNNNLADGGNGGALSILSPLKIINCTFDANRSPGMGGAIHAFAPGEITGSTFSNNQAGYEGGAMRYVGTLQITNSTFSDNSSPREGGALFTLIDPVVLTHCTFSGNSAPSGGVVAAWNGSRVTFRNSILKRGVTDVNYAVLNGDGAIVSQGFNLCDDDGGGYFNQPSDRVNLDPQIGPLLDNGGPTKTHAPLPGSPIFDQGYSFGVTTDQRGRERPYDRSSTPNAPGSDGTDIGAYEFSVCHYSLAPATANFAASGGTGSFTVTTPETCAWQAVSNSSFITITGPAEGLGSGTVNYQVDVNDQPTPRTGTITVNRQTFTIRQDAASAGASEPTISAVAVIRTEGSPTANSQIATVGDAQDALNTLSVTINGGASATAGGVTVSNITVDAMGAVRADVVAACGASNADFTLRVTDSGGLFAEATLNVTVNSNPPPSLGNYPNATVAPGGSVTITPNSPPADNGLIASLTASAPGFTGTLAGNPTTGAITITNANPAGSYTVTVKATDNCGVTATRAFTLNVTTSSCSVTVNPATLPQPYLAVQYSAALSASPAGLHTFSVSAGALPPGLQLVKTGPTTFISGVPDVPGTYSFTIKAQRNGTTCEGTRSYTVTIPATVVPFLRCVRRVGGNTYTAYFGYDNSTGAAVTIPVGSNNYFTPGNQNRGQTTVFQPGRVTNAFSVTFTKGRSNNLAVWLLRGPDGVLRPVNVLTTSIGCP